MMQPAPQLQASENRADRDELRPTFMGKLLDNEAVKGIAATIAIAAICASLGSSVFSVRWWMLTVAFSALIFVAVMKSNWRIFLFIPGILALILVTTWRDEYREGQGAIEEIRYLRNRSKTDAGLKSILDEMDKELVERSELEAEKYSDFENER